MKIIIYKLKLISWILQSNHFIKDEYSDDGIEKLAIRVCCDSVSGNQENHWWWPIDTFDRHQYSEISAGSRAITHHLNEQHRTVHDISIVWRILGNCRCKNCWRCIPGDYIFGGKGKHSLCNSNNDWNYGSAPENRCQASGGNRINVQYAEDRPRFEGSVQ